MATIDLGRLAEVNSTLLPLAKRYERDAATRVAVTVSNSVRRVSDTGDGDNCFVWELQVVPSAPELIKSVAFQLHETFTPSRVVVEVAPFKVSRQGWGTFQVGITVTDMSGRQHNMAHDLCFNSETDNSHVESILVAPLHAAGSADDESKGDAEATAASTARRMTGVDLVGMHGHVGKSSWNAPLLITYCDAEARPGYNTMKAHEYLDDPQTLKLKVKALADLIRRSKRCVAYTGAGISTASGIDDYASKSKKSVATGSRAKRPVKRGLRAEPTFAHYTLTALHKAGHLKHWVQQNHDGLPQKAGYPQQHLNEIHGAWFDPSNPVVPMTGSLRDDLCEWMYREEKAADLVLAMGTSLCGMNADRMVETPGKKALRGEGLGSVIIGLQRTQLDPVAALRIYAKIDDVMLMLAHEMTLAVPLTPYKPTIPKASRVERLRHTFVVPYDKKGRRSTTTTTKWSLEKWSLEIGSKIKITAGPGKGYKGVVTSVSSSHGGYTVTLPCQREGHKDQGKVKQAYALGCWFPEAACNGTLDLLPFVNIR